MSMAAARLRAQKVYSTDPDYLERMACEEEARERMRRRLGLGSSATPHPRPRLPQR